MPYLSETRPQVRLLAAACLGLLTCLTIILSSSSAPTYGASGYTFSKAWPNDPTLPVIDYPVGVGRDATGDTYIIDGFLRHVIRIDATGDVQARWGAWSETDDYNLSAVRTGLVNETGDVYVAMGQRVVKYDRNGNNPQVFHTSITWSSIQDAALGIEDDLWVLDSRLGILRFDSDGTLLSTWAGIDGDEVAVDPSGYVFVLDFNTVTRYNSSGVAISSWTAPNGFDEGELFMPDDMAFDDDGDLWFADSDVKKFSSTGTFIANVIESGSSSGSVSGLGALAISDGYVLTGEGAAHRVQKFSTTGVLGSSIGNPTAAGKMALPQAVAYHRNGYVYVADTENNRIQRYDSDGRLISQWGSYGSDDNQFNNPTGVAVDSSGSVYVADNGNDRVKKFTASGVFIDDWSASDAYSLAVKGGYVYVGGGSSSSSIRKYTDTGSFIDSKSHSWIVGERTMIFGSPNCESTAIAVSPDDLVYVASEDCNQVSIFTADLDYASGYAHGWAYYNSTEDGKFDGPSGIDTDNLGYVYLMDSGNQRVQKLEADGSFISSTGTAGTEDAELHRAAGIAVTPAGSSFFFADLGNNRVQKFSRSPVGAGLWLPEWQTQYGGLQGDEANAAERGADGRFIFAGRTSKFTHPDIFGYIPNDDYSSGSYRDDAEDMYSYADTSYIDGIPSYDSAYDLDFPHIFEKDDSSDQRTYYLAGQTGGTFDAFSARQGGRDYFIARHNLEDGERKFIKLHGSAGDDKALSVAAEDSGSVLVAGETDGTLPGQQNFGGMDAFIARLDQTGDVIWQNQTGDAGPDSAFAIDNGPAGSVVFAGRTGPDAFITKLNSGGGTIWSRQLSGSVGAEARALAVDGAGQIYVAGHVTGSSELGEAAGGQDIWLAKYSDSGSQVWARRWGKSASDQVNDLKLDKEGNIYLAGTVPADPSDPQSRGGADAFFRIYSNGGGLVAANRYGSKGDDVGSAIALDPSGEKLMLVGSVGAALQNRPDISGPSDMFAVTFSRGLGYEKPVLGAFSPAAGKIDLRWTQPGADSNITAYRVYDASSDKVLGATSKRQFMVSGVSADAVRSFYVRPFSADRLAGPRSNTVRVKMGDNQTTPVSGGDQPVTVNPVSGLSLTYEIVTVAGETTADPAVVSPASLPFKLIGDAIEVSTNATFAGQVDVARQYDPSDFSGDDSMLRLYHFTGGEWEDVTDYVDTENNVIYGKLSSFSPLAVGVPDLASTGPSDIWPAIGLILVLTGAALAIGRPGKSA